MKVNKRNLEEAIRAFDDPKDRRWEGRETSGKWTGLHRKIRVENMELDMEAEGWEHKRIPTLKLIFGKRQTMVLKRIQVGMTDFTAQQS